MMAILDFSKVVDVVPHQRLLGKLQQYGIHGNIHSWISSFLIDRKQCVMVDGDHSEHVHVDSGVPQDTVIWAPLLFLLYINDLPCNVKSHIRLFADDCLLYRPIIYDPQRTKFSYNKTSRNSAAGRTPGA